MSHRVIHGDCTVVLRDLAREGVLVDAVAADGPYHLASIVARLGSPDAAPIQSGVTGVYARSSTGFMGQQWDGGDIAFRPDTWRRVFDVMKPGAHLVAFAATKGYHRLACAIEDAGFEIRDMIAWLYGTGFPKSHNLDGDHDGWGTALKPAIEPIVFAQKPISEASIAENVARWGVGAINIDACRIETDDELRDGAGKLWSHYRGAPGVSYAPEQRGTLSEFKRLPQNVPPNPLGRWPANVCHDGSAEVLEEFSRYGDRGALAPVGERGADIGRAVFGAFAGNSDNGATFQGDSGTAARFFYSSKATQGERIFECRTCGAHTVGKPACGHDDLRTHPTVKPISLMEWLVKLAAATNSAAPRSAPPTTPWAASPKPPIPMRRAENARYIPYETRSPETSAHHRAQRGGPLPRRRSPPPDVGRADREGRSAAREGLGRTGFQMDAGGAGIMADDWQAGDLALCVDDSPARRVAGHRENSDPVSLVRGRLYTVLFVGPDVYGKGFVGLAVTCTAWGWFADRFIKVTPPEADEFDRETIALLNGEQVPA